MERRRILCTVCPVGCEITVYVEKGRVVSVEGAGCPRGREFAEKEVREPERPFFAVVPVRCGDLSTVSVRSTGPVPKKLIPELVRLLSNLVLEAPVEPGAVILRNPLGLGVDIVATRRVRRVCDNRQR